MPTDRSRVTLALLAAAAVALSGCGGDDSKERSPAAPRPAPSTPAPSYAATQVKSALLTAEEIGPGMRNSDAELGPLKRKMAPMCSISAVALPGGPETTSRQFIKRGSGGQSDHYGRLVARYDDPGEAAAAHRKLAGKARSCPAKRHFPARRIPGDLMVPSHDDTWRVTEGSIGGWRQLRGHEKTVEPPGSTKYPVYYMMYDYLLRGNVVLVTFYWEWTRPSAAEGPIARRATEILTKQLQKIG